MEKAFNLMYDRLASFLVENLDFRKVSIILEAGCGKGQLTIPLVKEIRKINDDFRVIALDLSSGPYEEHLEVLKKKAQGEKLQKIVAVVNGDVRDMNSIENESIDIALSNELFCDMDRNSLEKTIKEFYRILKPNGQMAHGELSPVPENEAQRLVIEANAYSLETTQPKPKWFSPYSDEVAALMHKTGFRNIRTKYFETNIKMGYDMAVKALKQWSTDPAFIKKKSKTLRKFGLEYPMEHVIFCEKT